MDEAKESIRVLVVDDERAVADSLTLILQASGYEATPAYSAEQAVEICAEANPHIVVSDVVMGQMSGFDLAIWLAENRPGCRIILMSAHSFHNPLVAKSMHGGFEFFPKPLHPDKFLAKLAAPYTESDSSGEHLEETKTSEE